MVHFARSLRSAFIPTHDHAVLVAGTGAGDPSCQGSPHGAKGSPLHPRQLSPLAFQTAVVAESTCIFVALTKLQGRIFVNEISALASDAPNVSSVATRVAEQSRRPGMARKHVCRRSRDIHEHLRAGLRLYAFWQFLKARTQWLQCTRPTGSPF
jgi:hypothetical protein